MSAQVVTGVGQGVGGGGGGSGVEGGGGFQSERVLFIDAGAVLAVLTL